MVKLDKFDIVFLNPESAFFAGQDITGKIVIDAKEPKKINEILLEIKGKAKTYWTKHSGKSRKHCTASEPYFCEQFNTCYTHQFSETQRSCAESGNRTLPTGLHEIPFSYALPKNLPTTFEGEFGCIRYTCKATCERPWDFDIITTKAFTVIGIEDINTDLEAKQPTSISECKSSARFYCLRPASVSTDLCLERSSYTPGETIQVKAAVRNETHRSLKNCSLKLVQLIKYSAKSFDGNIFVKEVSKTIARKDLGEVPKQSNTEWNDQNLTIPSLPPKLSRCKIICINYAVQFQIDEVLTSLQIHIGTIPLLSTMSLTMDGNFQVDKQQDVCTVEIKIIDERDEVNFMLSDERNGQDSNQKMVELSNQSECTPMKSQIPLFLNVLYPTLRTPVFRESISGCVEIFEENNGVQYGERKFTPKYPFYMKT